MIKFTFQHRKENTTTAINIKTIRYIHRLVMRKSVTNQTFSVAFLTDLWLFLHHNIIFHQISGFFKMDLLHYFITIIGANNTFL